MIINWQKAAGYQLTFVANVDQVSAELLRAGSNHIDLLFNWCLKKKRERKEVRYKERERERIDWGGVGVATFYPRFYSDLSRQQKKRRKKAKREDF